MVADALCGGAELADAAACCADWSALLADWTTLLTLVAGAVEAGADVEAAAEVEARIACIGLIPKATIRSSSWALSPW